jgi:magnesium chelatase family protein
VQGSFPHGCPCGFQTDPQRICHCSASQIQRYNARISGPLLDRIDIYTEVPPVPYAAMEARAAAESSAAIRERVNAARARQRRRFAGTPVPHNAAMGLRQLRRFGRFDAAGERLLEQAVRHYGVSARGQDRIRKVARTIADLAGADTITALHVSEAVQYRMLDRQ